jgi:hypothetical protein
VVVGTAGGMGETKRRRASTLSGLKSYLWIEIFGSQEYYEKEEVRSRLKAACAYDSKSAEP